ncbi:MAG: phosphoribosylamine--glycine ligase [Candidatus Thorarchaeota archaeon]
MTRVLLVGNGAREHAIAASLHVADVELVARMSRNNPGIASISREVSIGPLDDFTSYPSLDGVDYAVIGPEAPLAAGVVDFLEGRGVPCVGPNKTAARIETSKVFARQLLSEVAPRANPQFGVARSKEDIAELIETLGLENTVIKPDGLTGGKGVKIFGEHLASKDEVIDYASSLIAKDGVVVLEQKLSGIEFTVQTLVDGHRIVPMPLVRDYKRAHDNDTGPNTGSMGSYSQRDHGLSYISPSDLEEALDIMRAVVRGLAEKAGARYRGILYGQFMKTDRGIHVIEFNARYGDPEALNVLTILSDSADEVYQSLIDSRLIIPRFRNLATVCVYVVPQGYPGPDVVRDAEITIEEGTQSVIYYASVYEREGRIFTTGSRALGVLATAETVEEARQRAYADVSKISGPVRYRTDIAANVREVG